FFRLSCRVAIKSGWAKYTDFYNWVPEGSWVGGICGLKSIISNEKYKLSTTETAEILNALRDKGYVSVCLNGKTYEVGLVYQAIGDECYIVPEPTTNKVNGRNGGSFYNKPVPVTRWNSDFVQEGIINNFNKAKDESEYDINWNGKVETDLTPEKNNLVYNYSNEGWIPLPKAVFDQRANVYQEKKDKRNRIEKTKHQAERFSPCEAFLDLFAHTVYRDFDNFFSWFAPCVMIGDDALLTCRSLASRWGWGKSEVQRFLKEHSEVFECVMMHGNCGSVIFNKMANVEDNIFLPSEDDLNKYLEEVVGAGHRSREYANVYINYLSFLFVRKYFCRGKFCPEGDAIRQFVELCKSEDVPILEDFVFRAFTIEEIYAVAIPRGWQKLFSGPPDLPDFDRKC
ncbi:MAG: hypothetical protein UGF89_10475, partial [Acutalibacteraceae bacterium]|nr:hypothetical protein [Acutalibacteraceae bacterium]